MNTNMEEYIQHKQNVYYCRENYATVSGVGMNFKGGGGLSE